jgi:hypothetical protein
MKMGHEWGGPLLLAQGGDLARGSC